MLQIFKNFKLLTNREVLDSNNPMFNLYGQYDINSIEMNSFEYGLLIKDLLKPNCLNIIEGGTSFYQYFLNTKTLNEPEFDVKTMYLYYDTSVVGNRLRKRSEIMFLEGVFDEFLEHRKYQDKCRSEWQEKGHPKDGDKIPGTLYGLRLKNSHFSG
jgi:tRNA A37 N6-isopentenylltransferase MiaA